MGAGKPSVIFKKYLGSERDLSQIYCETQITVVVESSDRSEVSTPPGKYKFSFNHTQSCLKEVRHD